MPRGQYPRQRTPAVDRVLARVVEDGDCWVCTLKPTRYGYVVVHDNGVPRPAHRVVYEAVVGVIPEGLTLDHVKARGCRHKTCVNPAHLEPVTNRENVLRQWAAGDADPGRANREKTHCPHGHPYDVVNTKLKVTANGVHRVCRACNRDYATRRRRERGVQPRA